VKGATAVFWSDQACYGISTPWTLWRSQDFAFADLPRGGASAGNFGLVWTAQSAYAYHAASGQWIARDLDGPSLGGIGSDGFGIVWTERSVLAFDPTPGNWIAIDLGGVEGISAAGAGSVGIVWGHDRAQAYSGLLDGWYELTTGAEIQGASAGGEVALVWDTGFAYCFDAAAGIWRQVDLANPEAGIEPVDVTARGFEVSPNPASGRLSLDLPGEEPWTVRLIDAQGRAVRTLNPPATSGRTSFQWDGCDEAGRTVPAGSYWIWAASDSRTEVQRVVILR